jgi:hypothetical protein
MVRKQCWGCGMTCLLSPKGNIMQHSPKNTLVDHPEYSFQKGRSQLWRDIEGIPIICKGSGTRPETAEASGKT